MECGEPPIDLRWERITANYGAKSILAKNHPFNDIFLSPITDLNKLSVEGKKRFQSKLETWNLFQHKKPITPASIALKYLGPFLDTKFDVIETSHFEPWKLSLPADISLSQFDESHPLRLTMAKIEVAEYGESLTCFTDASKVADKVGIDFFIPKDKIEISRRFST